MIHSWFFVALIFWKAYITSIRSSGLIPKMIGGVDLVNLVNDSLFKTFLFMYYFSNFLGGALSEGFQNIAKIAERSI